MSLITTQVAVQAHCDLGLVGWEPPMVSSSGMAWVMCGSLAPGGGLEMQCCGRACMESSSNLSSIYERNYN